MKFYDPESSYGQSTLSYITLGMNFFSHIQHYPQRDLTFRIQYIPSYSFSTLKSSHRLIENPSSDNGAMMEIKRDYFIVCKNKKIHQVITDTSVEFKMVTENISTTDVLYIAAMQEDIRSSVSPIEVVFIFKKGTRI